MGGRQPLNKPPVTSVKFQAKPSHAKVSRNFRGDPFHMACRENFRERRLVILELRFGPALVVKLASTDQNPVPNCPGRRPGNLGPNFGQSTLAVWPKPAQTGSQKPQTLSHESLAGKPYDLWTLGFSTLPDLCESSLRRVHANLLCIVPFSTDDPRRESTFGH